MPPPSHAPLSPLSRRSATPAPPFVGRSLRGGIQPFGATTFASATLRPSRQDLLGQRQAEELAGLAAWAEAQRLRRLPTKATRMTTWTTTVLQPFHCRCRAVVKQRDRRRYEDLLQGGGEGTSCEPLREAAAGFAAEAPPQTKWQTMTGTRLQLKKEGEQQLLESPRRFLCRDGRQRQAESSSERCGTPSHRRTQQRTQMGTLHRCGSAHGTAPCTKIVVRSGTAPVGW
mmetsp:Transcript_33608/g.39125  ORF Transcript_33608/g.39125 Transcript_33608/m.39125 type:complete len:229 (+) Transcript_33608:760-1446(+)